MAHTMTTVRLSTPAVTATSVRAAPMHSIICDSMMMEPLSGAGSGLIIDTPVDLAKLEQQLRQARRLQHQGIKLQQARALLHQARLVVSSPRTTIVRDGRGQSSVDRCESSSTRNVVPLLTAAGSTTADGGSGCEPRSLELWRAAIAGHLAFCYRELAEDALHRMATTTNNDNNDDPDLSVNSETEAAAPTTADIDSDSAQSLALKAFACYKESIQLFERHRDTLLVRASSSSSLSDSLSLCAASSVVGVSVNDTNDGFHSRFVAFFEYAAVLFSYGTFLTQFAPQLSHGTTPLLPSALFPSNPSYFNGNKRNLNNDTECDDVDPGVEAQPLMTDLSAILASLASQTKADAFVKVGATVLLLSDSEGSSVISCSEGERMEGDLLSSQSMFVRSALVVWLRALQLYADAHRLTTATNSTLPDDMESHRRIVLAYCYYLFQLIGCDDEARQLLLCHPVSSTDSCSSAPPTSSLPLCELRRWHHEYQRLSQINNRAKRERYDTKHPPKPCSLASCNVREAFPQQFNVCARCRHTVYCCADHQRKDWGRHKATDCVPHEKISVHVITRSVTTHHRVTRSTTTLTTPISNATNGNSNPTTMNSPSSSPVLVAQACSPSFSPIVPIASHTAAMVACGMAPPEFELPSTAAAASASAAAAAAAAAPSLSTSSARVNRHHRHHHHQHHHHHAPSTSPASSFSSNPPSG